MLMAAGRQWQALEAAVQKARCPLDASTWQHHAERCFKQLDAYGMQFMEMFRKRLLAEA
jgi:hypothetical protein